MNKAFETVRNVYVTPQVVFEELEVDEKDMLLAVSENTGGGGDFKPGDGGDPNPDEDDALDLDFSMDFVINDEPQL